MATVPTPLVIAGPHFSDPRFMTAYSVLASGLNIFDVSAAATASSVVAHFTELTTRGVIDTTNWTAGTYKTLLSVSSGSGVIAAIVACTAGGAQTTTFEITIDGVLREITITNASGERALLVCGGLSYTSQTYTTAAHAFSSTGSLDAGTKSYIISTGAAMPEWGGISREGVPLLRYTTSLLIRAKHSATITNSTSTAYSGVMYRAGIAT